MRNILKENTAERWEMIQTRQEYAERVDEVRRAAEQCLNESVSSLPHSKFILFEQTGNRYIYEDLYFERRKRLNVFAFMSKLTGEQKYIDALEDIIWHICDEYTWALPAHVRTEQPIAKQKIWLDLFACETGFALAEIYCLLEDVLSDLVKRRIQSELRTRIIDSFLNRDESYFWETVKNNWAAVCAGSILAVFLYCAEQEEIAAALPQLENTFSYFLQSFTEDGCCLEGYDYWNYGFGFFVMGADLLRNYTNGATDYFKLDKVRTVAHYQQKIILRSPDAAVSFADGSEKFSAMYGLSHYLKREYADLYLPRQFAPVLQDHCYRWGHFIRAFLWTDSGSDNESRLAQTDIFAEAGWYIHRTPDYTLAVKAGHNDEPHNHNDIGSFIFCTEDGQVLCDFGAGEYVKDYFREKRYEFLVTRSLGHSVPYINGREQAAGAEYCGKLLRADDDGAMLEIGGAYPDKTIQSVKRSFRFTEDGAVMRDEFEFSAPPSEVKERFVTLIEPQIDAVRGKIVIGAYAIDFSPQIHEVEVSTEVYSDHRGKPTKAYLIDAIAKNPAQVMVWDWYIHNNERSKGA